MTDTKMSPPARQSVVPHLICDGAAAAMEFYKKIFGATELMRLPGKDGKVMHGCIEIGGSCIFLVDESPAWGALGPKTLKGSPVTIHLNVSDVDAVMARAVEAGATLAMPAQDMFWGDRYGKIIDPFGHHWSIATHLRDMTPGEIQAAAAACGM